MIDDDERRMVFIGMAAMAGSVTALAAMDWKNMSWIERLLTVFVGFAFAVFIGPLVAERFLHIPYADLQGVCGLVYLGGTGWNILMPVVLKRARTILQSVLGGGEVTP